MRFRQKIGIGIGIWILAAISGSPVAAQAGQILLAEKTSASGGDYTTSSAIRDRTMTEIQELEKNQQREEVLYEQQIDKVRQKTRTAEMAGESYAHACATSGKSSPQALQAEKNLAEARKQVLLAISQKDHILYHVGILEKGISDRKFLLEVKRINPQ